MKNDVKAARYKIRMKYLRKMSGIMSKLELGRRFHVMPKWLEVLFMATTKGKIIVFIFNIHLKCR